MLIDIFYAHWEDYGEPWSTPLGFVWELESRGHQICKRNLYHANGQLLPQKKIRSYSGDCFNRFSADYRNKYRPDAILVMDYGPFDYVGADRKFFPDVPFILEAGDTPQSCRTHLQKTHKFDAVITPDYLSTLVFRNSGVKAEWFTHWADTRIFHPNYNIEPQFDIVSTCGGRRVTEAMSKVFGERFNNERYFFGEEHAKRLMMGRIVFQCSQFGEITRRIFEGMACGRMVLTDRLDKSTRINELFIDGEDIVFYDDAADAIEKAEYFSQNHDERERIAANGHKKVMANHTVSNRVDQFERLIHDLKRQTSIA
jgi:hypothetical protein